jgi:CBS domain containing-hemolysin-like protein
MDHVWLYLGVMVLALLLSFFMSGMEAGVLALSPIRIRHWVRTGKPRAHVLHAFLERPEDFLWTILVGNALANFTAVSLLVLMLFAALRERPLLALVIFLGALFLFYAVGDLLPKMLFRTFPNRLCLLLVGPFRVIHWLLRPLVRLLARISRRLGRWGGGEVSADRLFVNRDELRLLLQESEEALSSDERRMINRVLDLPGRLVVEFMTPMERVVAVELNTPMAEVLRLGRDRGLTRFPVWHPNGAGRRIAGLVSLRRAVYDPGLDAARRAGDYLTSALYLGERTSLETALHRMQRSGQRLAIVLGPTQKEVGVLSLNDILRFVFGEVSL